MSRKLYLAHTGTPQLVDFDPHGSGRYRQGSGDNPHQHGFSFIFEYEKAKKQFPNYSEAELASEIFHMTTKEMRAKKQYQYEELKSYLSSKVYHMRHDQQMSTQAIADKLSAQGYHMSEKNVRVYLELHDKPKEMIIKNTAEALKSLLVEHTDKADGERQYLDVGEGTSQRLRISKEQFAAALERLKDEGYIVNNIQVAQINPLIKGQKTTMKLLGEPGQTPHDQAVDAYKDLSKIHYINEYYSEDGISLNHIEKPKALDSKRIEINYADSDGTQKMDGVIELRRGVADLDLGPNQKYAQVRINVDNKYYLKGMAIYADDLPEGIDVRFNTNKMEGAPISKVFKPLKRKKSLEDGSPDPDSPIDWDNPFGATIKPLEKGGQHHYIDENGNKQLSLINKVNEEGSWNEWSKSLASQMLSKQSLPLAEAQLDISYKVKLEEYEAIQNIGIPAVKQKMLKDFADSCDEDAVNLKAWSMPGQSTKVLLPGLSLKDNECYCPDYENGTKLALIRYPHSGPEEIVELTVNNNNKECQKRYGKTPTDGIAIPYVSTIKLSGADYDGDSAVVIPNDRGAIDVKEMLRDMQSFDAKIAYATDGTKETMSKRSMGIEMGKAANLITDMRVAGCDDQDELTRAFKYSQVVVDAHKHKLDWHQAQKDLGIKELRKKYQGTSQGRASTIISRASGPQDVDERAIGYTIDPETGEKKYRYTKHTKLKKIDNGDGTYTYVETEEKVKSKSKKMYEAKDAYELVSNRDNPYPMEIVYADYANNLKDLARKSRIESTQIVIEKPTAKAKEIYAEERASIDEKLFKRDEYAPSDRAALRYAQIYMKAVKEDNPNMDNDEYKRKSAQTMNAARSRVYPNGKKEKITITDKEWEAIQNNAIDKSKVDKLLMYADDESVKSRALPKNDGRAKLSPAQIATLKAKVAGGFYTWEQIAKEYNISVSTAKRYNAE